mgnify:FL=1
MKKIKIVTIVGTRPEIIRLSCIINQLNSINSINHILIHTGQNYDYNLNKVFFEDLNIKSPDYFLNAAKDSASQTIGLIIEKVDPLLAEIKPDAVLVLGDTNSCLAVISAKKRKIPIFHMEAGNRCYDQRVPEEINRKIVDHISDINLTYSDISREYLIKEGFPVDRIIKTGSPIFEVLETQKDKIISSKILKKFGLEKHNYFLVSSHREENVNYKKRFTSLMESLNKICAIYKMPIIFSTHPRTKKVIDEMKMNCNELIKFVDPLGFNDYNFLQINSLVVLSDSGTISEESSILNFRALNIRESHERPEAFEEASVMMVGLDSKRIIQAIELVLKQPVGQIRDFNLVKDYSYNNVSKKVVRIILSYIDYVNRVVWQKES